MIKLLAGENYYLSLIELNALKKKMQEENPFLQVNIVEGDEIKNLEDVLKGGEMNSFFSNKSLTIVKRIFRNRSSKLLNELAQHLSAGNYDIIFWEDVSVDKRLKLYKTLSTIGEFQEFKNLPLAKQKFWAREIFHEGGIEVSDELLEMIIERVGDNQAQLAEEIKKLILFLHSQGNNKLSKEDIYDLVSVNFEENVWEFIDKMASTDNKNALEILENLVKEQADYQIVLGLIVRQLRILYMINLFISHSASDISKLIGIHSFVVTKAYSIAKRLGKDKIVKAYDKLLRLDQMVKLGQVDPKLGLDLFVLTLI